jgi:hypothetical protein
LAGRIGRRGISEEYHRVRLWVPGGCCVLYRGRGAGLCITPRPGTADARPADVLVLSFLDAIGRVDPVDNPLGALDQALRLE